MVNTTFTIYCPFLRTFNMKTRRHWKHFRLVKCVNGRTATNNVLPLLFVSVHRRLLIDNLRLDSNALRLRERNTSAISRLDRLIPSNSIVATKGIRLNRTINLYHRIAGKANRTAKCGWEGRRATRGNGTATCRWGTINGASTIFGNNRQNARHSIPTVPRNTRRLSGNVKELILENRLVIISRQ